MMAARRTTGLDVEEHDDDGMRTLVLSGELDLATVPALQRAIARLCAADGTRGIALDLHGVVFIDSAGLAAVIYASRLCERYEYDFAITRRSQAVQRLFELTGLTELLPVREDVAGGGQT